MVNLFKKPVVIGLILIAGVTALFFQNCAKTKFIDPDIRHSSIALGFCQECSDELGKGLSCRTSEASAFSSCFYESCNVGFRLEDTKCVRVGCTPGTPANCEVAHGQGRMNCTESGEGYTSCIATECEVGYKLADNQCVKVEEPPTEEPPPQEPTPICTPSSTRDCSTESTNGVETCDGDGMSYSACELGDCKPGYHKEENSCVANSCEPDSVTPCSVGAGVGYLTCNSAGSGWGSCEINGCEQGYIMQDGVCVVQVCTAGTEYACDFANGTGVKICNESGTDYGTCNLQACDNGYTLVSGQCQAQACQPGSKISCRYECGSGEKTCNLSGMGYGECAIASCDPGFKLKDGQCVDKDSCEVGDTVACSKSHGTGVRTCEAHNHPIFFWKKSHKNKWGPCKLTDCDDGYWLFSIGDVSACIKKMKHH